MGKNLDKKLIFFASPNDLILEAMSRVTENSNLTIQAISGWSKKSSANLESHIQYYSYEEIWEFSLNGSFTGIHADLLASPIFQINREEINVAKSMLDRMDLFQNFSFQDRKLIIEYIICYWIQELEKNKPDLIFFASTPHEVIDYCLYVVCMYLKVPIRILCETWTFDTKYLSNSYISRDQIIYEVPGLENHNSNSVISKFVNLTKSHTIAKHKSIKFNESLQEISKLKKLTNFVIKFPKIFSAIQRIIQRNRLILGIEADSSNILLKKLYLVNLVSMEFLQVVRMKLNQRSLKNYYKKNSYVKTGTGIKYVYFCLQFQPEMSTSPCGEFYVDQHLAIAQISLSIPDDWKIFVKEHPAQMYKQGFYGHLGRDKSFYSRLLAIPKVELVSLNSDHFQLIDKSKFVSTITGTVGMEAIARGIPALIFGNIWYEKMPLVFSVHNLTDKLPLDEITESAKQDIDTFNSVLPEVNKFLEKTFKLFLSPHEAHVSGYSWNRDENLSAMIKVIISAAETVH